MNTEDDITTRRERDQLEQLGAFKKGAHSFETRSRSTLPALNLVETLRLSPIAELSSSMASEREARRRVRRRREKGDSTPWPLLELGCSELKEARKRRHRQRVRSNSTELCFSLHPQRPIEAPVAGVKRTAPSLRRNISGAFTRIDYSQGGNSKTRLLKISVLSLPTAAPTCERRHQYFGARRRRERELTFSRSKSQEEEQ